MGCCGRIVDHMLTMCMSAWTGVCLLILRQHADVSQGSCQTMEANKHGSALIRNCSQDRTLLEHSGVPCNLVSYSSHCSNSLECLHQVKQAPKARWNAVSTHRKWDLHRLGRTGNSSQWSTRPTLCYPESGSAASCNATVMLIRALGLVNTTHKRCSMRHVGNRGQLSAFVLLWGPHTHLNSQAVWDGLS